MDDSRPYLTRGASLQKSGEASVAAGGCGKGIRATSPGSEGREAAGTETSAWTGEKKTKIQSAPSSGDLGTITRDDTEHSEQIEGLERGMDKLDKEVDCCIERPWNWQPDDDCITEQPTDWINEQPTEESGEASVAAASAGMGSRTPSLVSEGRDTAGTETTSAWTGEKKAKIQRAPSSGDLDMIPWDDTEHSEQIEGLQWERGKLEKEIDSCLERLHDGVPDDDDGGVWTPNNEQQLTALDQRLALYRIRAMEFKYRELDDASLTAIYPPSKLEDNGYYGHYQCCLEWYFDDEYCRYVDFQDYQRLMLHSKEEYEQWEDYRKTCSTLEADQQYVLLWEKLSSKTKLIQLYLADTSCMRIEKLLFYHALKIAAGLPYVLKTSVHTGFEEFKGSVQFYHKWHKYYAGFFFEMWELVTKQKMNFKDAFRRIHNEGKYFYCTSAWQAELEKDEPNLYLPESYIIKPRTYYDYAKKKLGIAKEIGLIPKPPTKRCST